MKGAFLVCNAGDKDWGKDGYAWLMYDSLNTFSTDKNEDGTYKVTSKDGRNALVCRVRATGGELVTREETLEDTGLGRGAPRRFAFAFREPVGTATLEMTWEQAPEASACASAFINDICLASNLHMLTGERNGIFVRRWASRSRRSSNTIAQGDCDREIRP